jgi:N6-adenosine-specific RNA methylase IME4/ParB-like chromosome segregation protein Spo0J
MTAASRPQRTLPQRPPSALAAHAEAARIPVMPEEDYQAFRADVAARGLRVPIEINHEDVVLDGRQRLRAARDLGHERVPVRVVEAADELDYMLRAALLRRQLNASQRAALVVEFERYRALKTEGKKRQRANLRQASEVATSPPRGKTRDAGALWAGVSARTVQDAATVHENDKELFERVKRGELGAALAARRVRRGLRDRELPPAPPLPGGPFDVIYADPPWQLGNPDGPYSPESHYPTMALEEIKALPIPAGEDAVLFLWAVSGLLPQAFEVIEAWGFEYKTQLVWIKPSIGPGVWLRNRHEPLLVARRGAFPPPEPEDRVGSVLAAPRGRHSEKPERLYELIEGMYPHASKLELFARRGRHGWTAWGNEVAG